jgi:transcriptional regulator with XRE-family HTH domain
MRFEKIQVLLMQKNETLAQFISEARENAGYSQKGLAVRANIDISVIEDIESGRELFLATPVRQKLASALKLSSQRIKALEKQPETSEKDFELSDKIDELKWRILNEGLKGHNCPVCGSELACRVSVMYDLEENMIRHPKANCSKCPFQIK